MRATAARYSQATAVRYGSKSTFRSCCQIGLPTNPAMPHATRPQTGTQKWFTCSLPAHCRKLDASVLPGNGSRTISLVVLVHVQGLTMLSTCTVSLHRGWDSWPTTAFVVRLQDSAEDGSAALPSSDPTGIHNIQQTQQTSDTTAPTVITTTTTASM